MNAVRPALLALTLALGLGFTGCAAGGALRGLGLASRRAFSHDFTSSTVT